MNLKTKVFVLEVSNLSDARYCASMGVDTIAFSLTGDHAISKEEILAMSQWVSGVNIGIELDSSDEEVNQFIAENNFQVIISDDPEVLKNYSNKITILKTSEPIKSNFSYHYSTLSDLPNLIVDAPEINELDKCISQQNVAGLVLKGGEEIRPGYKTFDELADTLEALES